MSSYLLTDYSTAIRQEGGWVTLGADGGDAARRGEWPTCALHFKATPTDGTIGVRTFGQGQKISLFRFASGAWERVASITAANNSAFNSETIGTGLDTGTEYRWLVIFGDPFQYVAYVEVGSLNTATLAVRDTIAGFGDSTMAGNAGTGHDSSKSDLCQLALMLDLACYNRGIDGTTAKFSGVGRIADISGITPAPLLVLDAYGLNDKNQVGGAETVAEFKAAKKTIFEGISDALPDTPIICRGIIKTDGETSNTLWDAAISQAVNETNTLNGNSNCVFLDMRPLDATYDARAGFDTIDGTHQTESGMDKIFDYEWPLFAPAPSGNALLGAGFFSRN